MAFRERVIVRSEIGVEESAIEDGDLYSTLKLLIFAEDVVYIIIRHLSLINYIRYPQSNA